MEGKRMTSEKTSHPLNLVPARWQSGPAPAKEAAARAAIEARVGRPLSYREWARARANDRGSSPPGSSRRAGGYSPVLRLTADEMSLPLFPCPKKFTFWDTTRLPRGTFWVRVPRRPARGRPKAVFLLLACCPQEEDAGPATFTAASSCVQQASRRSFAACSPLEPRAGLPS